MDKQRRVRDNIMDRDFAKIDPNAPPPPDLRDNADWDSEGPTLPKVFVPVKNQVALQVLTAKGVTMGGVHLPETAAHKHEATYGWVIAVGPDVKQVKEGDKVCCGGSTIATNVYIDGVKYVVVIEDHINGIMVEGFRPK